MFYFLKFFYFRGKKIPIYPMSPRKPREQSDCLPYSSGSCISISTSGTDHEMIHTAVIICSAVTTSVCHGQSTGLSHLVSTHERMASAGCLFIIICKSNGGKCACGDMIIMTLGMLFLLLVLNAIMKVLKLNDRVRGFLWILIAANRTIFQSRNYWSVWWLIYALGKHYSVCAS